MTLYNQDGLKEIASNKEKYLKTPFLFLIASCSRNKAIEWADRNYTYKNKKQIGSWTIYRFDNI